MAYSIKVVTRGINKNGIAAGLRPSVKYVMTPTLVNEIRAHQNVFFISQINFIKINSRYTDKNNIKFINFYEAFSKSCLSKFIYKHSNSYGVYKNVAAIIHAIKDENPILFYKKTNKTTNRVADM
ncbi:hypothetical protein BN59_00890 [Legionella massiliensis]|uniref:Uncharacterized protein n=1 Tax=Legionella massiliensis TaxID=1034943 RepID=A0A078KUA3_9GAMM|nr:hypothetical protein [Legionella massiliensis]CDZ76616.1 hypothetical protein BN59_00890 [Legionella massiliensis]CEE12354.1 hypothetical protein BN1094_00890 [Legionella massiliensis]